MWDVPAAPKMVPKKVILAEFYSTFTAEACTVLFGIYALGTRGTRWLHAAFERMDTCQEEC